MFSDSDRQPSANSVDSDQTTDPHCPPLIQLFVGQIIKLDCANLRTSTVRSKGVLIIRINMSQRMRKLIKRHVRPAKTQISLGISPIWLDSSLSAWRKLGSLAIHLTHSEDSDQTGRMPRLIWVFAGHSCHLFLVLSFMVFFQYTADG